MKTPSFWQNNNIISTLFTPLGWAYGAITKLRIILTKPQKINCPVICIGNITAGGTGKTPVAISIAKILQNQGKNPSFISRGYGGKLKDLFVNTQKHSALDVGDEPLLLAAQAPVFINPDRFQAGLKACQNGADIILMDDGFQNPKLHKDLSFMVIDGNIGLGNEKFIPAGPLRESLKSGLKRAQAVIIIGEDKHNISARVGKKTIFFARIAPVKKQNTEKPIIAFAGIGRPEKFYNSLQESGFNLLKTIDFEDHHFYNESELQAIIAQAKELNAEIYTTSKDYVKIPKILQSDFKVLEIEIKWDNEKKLSDFLFKTIAL